MRSKPRELLENALALGADPADSADERFRKRLLVGTALIILPAGLLWGCLYWVGGELGAAALPWGYVGSSIVSLAIFSRTKSVRLPTNRAAAPHPRRPCASHRRPRWAR